MKIKILHQDCNPELANDTSLPYTTYLITYKLDGKVCYDIAMGSKKVEIFDHYWDNYRHDLIDMKQTEGRINPKLWGYQNKDKKKK